ncbi:hypothetical protein AVEN_271075-1 [Araneus ventricosus]|uniref:RNase H type-1 domain-containing protein n=1 Tax=Araneus ventricosus TaxID=182803 RepID=A0A4Y2FDB6_ARAVE|nr:hypothetical protein AVEN_271075-1 [Araneus ventricosus]
MFVLNLFTGCPSIDIKIKEENEIWQQQQEIKNLEKIGISFNFDYATEVSPGKITSIPWRTFNETNYVGINVFTDGSENNNRVGCAMVVFEDGNAKEHEIWRLNNETTVFIAEIVAIREAVNYCKRRQIAKAIIISDSRSALVSIESLEENRKFILDIKNSLQDTNNNCFGGLRLMLVTKEMKEPITFLRKPMKNKKLIFTFERPNNRGKRK